MKNISTLVSDIYNLFTNEQGVTVEREEAQKTIEDTTSGFIASQPTGSKNQTNNQIDITKRNISKRNLMQ